MHYQIERNYGCRVSDAWTYRGLKTAVLENELLRVVILVDKGADIYQFVHKPTDVDFLWRSPWGVRDPALFKSSTGGPAEMWLDVYEGGWQTVLPGGGYPSQYGDAQLGIHAEVNTVPWDCVIVEDTPERVSIRCSVRTARTPFFFEKTHTLNSGSAVLHTDEVLVNEGEEIAHCVWGEHIAIGEPFLSEDCVIDLPGGTLISHETEFHPNNRLKPGVRAPWPQAEDKDGNRLDLSIVPPKTVRAYDMSYVADMPEGWYSITNQKKEVGFGLVYPKDIFKFLWYWQSLGGGFGYPWYGRGYNIGLEPFTSYDNQGLAQAIENGTALTLEPGQRVEVSHKAVAYTGAERVERISPDGSVSRKR
jgi:hypothetical protein